MNENFVRKIGTRVLEHKADCSNRLSQSTADWPKRLLKKECSKTKLFNILTPPNFMY